tara:strand:+ start:422 stop:853 length:432 start_codon:yes stop_codon:yes gene_type:complete
MIWDTLKPAHCFNDPVTYIYTKNFLNTNEYDTLYENQNNLKHKTWQDFDSKYRIGFEFKDDYSNIDLSREVICLWFFRERADDTRSYIHLNGKKKLNYLANTLLITKSKDIDLIQKKKKYIRHPLVQLDMINSQWETLLAKYR